MPDYPTLMHTAIDATDCRGLAEFYRQLLGATLLYNRTDDDREPLFVLADPAGHPFCLLVSAW